MSICFHTLIIWDSFNTSSRLFVLCTLKILLLFQQVKLLFLFSVQKFLSFSSFLNSIQTWTLVLTCKFLSSKYIDHCQFEEIIIIRIDPTFTELPISLLLNPPPPPCYEEVPKFPLIHFHVKIFAQFHTTDRESVFYIHAYSLSCVEKN